MSKKIIFSLLFVASLTSGCGFQLQTTNSLQKNYPQIIFLGSFPDNFYKHLTKELILNGVNVINEKSTSDIQSYLKEDISVLTCSKLATSKESALSLSGNSQVLEYNHSSSISCQLYIPNKKPYQIMSTINRTYLKKSGSTISSNSEDAALTDTEMKQLAEQVLFRIENSYLIKNNEVKKEPSKTDEVKEKIKVVFNATNADETTKEIQVTKDELEKMALDKLSEETSSQK